MLYPARPSSAPATAPTPITMPADNPVTVPWAASSKTPTDAPPAVPTPAPTPATAVAFALCFSSSVISWFPNLDGWEAGIPVQLDSQILHCGRVDFHVHELPQLISFHYVCPFLAMRCLAQQNRHPNRHPSGWEAGIRTQAANCKAAI